MLKIIYASRATATPTQPELVELLALSRDRNEAGGVTGLLLYAHGSYLQYLEGDEDRVEALFDGISGDRRHTDIRLLARQPTAERRFADWAMGFAAPADVDLVSGLPGFQPSTTYPLVNAELVRNGAVAETLLGLYSRNT